MWLVINTPSLSVGLDKLLSCSAIMNDPQHRGLEGWPISHLGGEAYFGSHAGTGDHLKEIWLDFF